MYRADILFIVQVPFKLHFVRVELSLENNERWCSSSTFQQTRSFNFEFYFKIKIKMTSAA